MAGVLEVAIRSMDEANETMCMLYDLTRSWAERGTAFHFQVSSFCDAV